MGFYDEIAKDIKWEYAHNVEAYLKVVDGKLQLPSPKWLQFHLNYLDNVIEAISAFKSGQLTGVACDMTSFKTKTIDDPTEAVNCLRTLRELKHFSIDIETDNTLPDKDKNKILMIGLAYSDHEAVVFMRKCFGNKLFRILFQNFLNDKSHVFILHNGIFDRSRTKILEDIDIRIDEDTLLQHYCGINEHKGTHGLKGLAQLYLGFDEWEKPLDDWKRQYCRANKIKLKDFQYGYFPQDTLAHYCGIDVIATYRLHFLFKKLMRESSLNIYYKLIEASKYYADITSRGMLLDVDYWYKIRDELETERESLEKELDNIMPGVKVTSPKQLLAWLQDHFPNDGILSTDKYTMEDLIIAHPDDPAVTKILEYRKVDKLLKTYVYGLWDRKDTNNIIHGEFKLHGTETGRLSSSNPNMQNIPRDSFIKKLFIARPGYTLIQMDYSQAELRVLAYISNDKSLIQCYVDGRDLHTEIQKRLFKDKYDAHDKDQRVIAKTINFGIPYGRTAPGMASKLKISLAEANKYLNDWFENAPDVKKYIEQCHRMALSDPQDVYYTAFGRARHYFVTSSNKNHVANQAVNFPISSTANDLTIYSLCKIGHYIENNKLDAYIVNTVHDSIVIEVRPDQAKQLALKCQDIMATTPKKMLPNVTLPFRADADTGNCYGDMHEPDWGDDDEESNDD